MRKAFPVTYISIVAKLVQRWILQHVQIVWIRPKYRKKIAPMEAMVAVSNILGVIYSIIVVIDAKVKTRPSLFDHSVKSKTVENHLDL